MIAFYSADTPIPLRNRALLRTWLRELAASYKYELAGLSYVFCSDEYLLTMNRSFLSHDYYTDIITFPLEDVPAVVNAECYISVDRVKDNAKQIGITFAEELHRVMAHGLLHLLGFGDKSPQEEQRMRQEENKALMRLAFHVEQLKLNKNNKRGVPRGTRE
jgi:rRNA maturation RNase YbeY